MASTLPKPAPQPPSKLVRIAMPMKNEQQDTMDIDQPAAAPQASPEPAKAVNAAPSPAPPPTLSGTPAAEVPSASPVGATPWKTPEPLVSETVTPTTTAPAQGWQQLYQASAEDAGASVSTRCCAKDICKDAWQLLTSRCAYTVMCTGTGSTEVAEAASPAVQWSQPGAADAPSADVAFFFLDAHVEPNSPDTVYLFGKVCMFIYTPLTKHLHFSLHDTMIH